MSSKKRNPSNKRSPISITLPPRSASTPEEVEPAREAVTFGGADPAAWAWLNTWPFLDESAAGAGSGEEAEALAEPVVPDEPVEPVAVAPEEPVVPDEPVVPEEPVAPDEPVAVALAPAAFVPTRGPRRSWPRYVAAGLALLVAAGVGSLVWWHHGQGSVAPEAVRTAVDTYAPPVPLTGNRAIVRTQVLPSGRLRVTHWIHTEGSVDSVGMRLPAVAGLAPAAVALSHLVVASNGVVLPTRQQAGSDPRRTYALPPTHSIYVTYVLSGVVQRGGGTSGRALARITSLEVTTGATLERTTQSVVGARVLALACSSPTMRALPHPCGVEDDGSWHVALGRSESRERVMAQLDLS